MTLTSTIGATTSTEVKATTDKLLPPKRMMRAMEQAAEAEIVRALNRMRLDLLRGMTEANVSQLPIRLGSREVLQPFTDTMVAVITNITLAGADFGREQVERFVFGTRKKLTDPAPIGINWELVNTDAVDAARRYGYGLVTGITDTTRDRLQKEISAWLENGEELYKLRNRLSAPTGPFSPKRAQMIAVTETTRAWAEGNTAAWRGSGVIKFRRWQTSVDELVCPICGPLHNMVVGIDEPFPGIANPPAHPNCRCGVSPVVPGAEDLPVGLGPYDLGGGTIESGIAPSLGEFREVWRHEEDARKWIGENLLQEPPEYLTKAPDFDIDEYYRRAISLEGIPLEDVQIFAEEMQRMKEAHNLPGLIGWNNDARGYASFNVFTSTHGDIVEEFYSFGINAKMYAEGNIKQLLLDSGTSVSPTMPRFTVATTVKEAAIHESAHYYHWAKLGVNNSDVKKFYEIAKRTEYKGSTIINQISKYATFDEKEFYAEFFVHYGRSPVGSEKFLDYIGTTDLWNKIKPW